MTDNEKDILTEGLGGVQGSETEKTALDENDCTPKIATDVPGQPAPDAGEIEWAGGLIKKPPAPEN